MEIEGKCSTKKNDRLDIGQTVLPAQNSSTFVDKSPPYSESFPRICQKRFHGPIFALEKRMTSFTLVSISFPWQPTFVIKQTTISSGCLCFLKLLQKKKRLLKKKDSVLKGITHQIPLIFPLWIIKLHVRKYFPLPSPFIQSNLLPNF